MDVLANNRIRFQILSTDLPTLQFLCSHFHALREHHFQYISNFKSPSCLSKKTTRYVSSGILNIRLLKTVKIVIELQPDASGRTGRQQARERAYQRGYAETVLYPSGEPLDDENISEDARKTWALNQELERQVWFLLFP